MNKVETQSGDNVSEAVDNKLERLIAEQGVRPIADFEELAALWPADDDPNALLDYVLSERRARSKLNQRDQQSI